jgi:hypothetical protein
MMVHLTMLRIPYISRLLKHGKKGKNERKKNTPGVYYPPYALHELNPVCGQEALHRLSRLG